MRLGHDRAEHPEFRNLLLNCLPEIRNDGTKALAAIARDTHDDKALRKHILQILFYNAKYKGDTACWAVLEELKDDKDVGMKARELLKA